MTIKEAESILHKSQEAAGIVLAELSRLQAEREKIPKTADDVLIYPGMKIRDTNGRMRTVQAVCNGYNLYSTDQTTKRD